jgi:hypothetical protein
MRGTSDVAIPRWGLYMMFTASVVGAYLLGRQLWG